MKALVYEAPYVLNLREREVPEPEAEEVLLKVGAVGICGSEVEGFMGRMPKRRIPPLVMGHEFAGEVVQLGPGVAEQFLGQRVLVNPLMPCQQCELCRAGRSNICPNRRLIGMHRPGAMAEFVTVPQRCLLPLPDPVTYPAAVVTEPLANAVHLLKHWSRQVHEAVVVIGTGAIGLSILMVLRLAGAGRIINLETNPGRLRMAQELGADLALNPRDTDVLEAVQTATQGRGADLVVDAVGSRLTRNQALHLARPGGQVIYIGLNDNQCELESYEIVLRELRVQGTYGYDAADFQRALDLVAAGRINTERWVHTLPLEAGPQAFADLASGQDERIKVILEP